MANFTGSKVFRVGPLCLKRYGYHKRQPSISPETRLRHEVVGAGLLKSKHITVAEPLIRSNKGAWCIRRWYKGSHPSQHKPPNISDVRAFAFWLVEHRNRGFLHPFRMNSHYPITTRFRMFGICDVNNPLVIAVMQGSDLLHGDLVPENLLIGNKLPVVLDSESACVGLLAWDVSFIVALLTQLANKNELVREFLSIINLSDLDKELMWNLVRLLVSSEWGSKQISTISIQSP